MKKFKSILVLILLISAFISCKKSNVTPQNVYDAKITQIVESSTNSNTISTTISYDDQNRNKDWKFDGLELTKYYNYGARALKFQYILNNEGMAIEGNSQDIQQNNRRKFTYDNQKRLIKITVEEQYVNNNGSPTTNFLLTDTYDVNWNSDNNISTIRRTYTGQANTGGISYWIYNFEGYSNNYLNTLKPKNIGLDIFGSQGYPSIIEGGGNGYLLNGPFFAGAQLPTKIIQQGFAKNNDPVQSEIIRTYDFEKDSQNRITVLKPKGQSFRFNYK